MDIEKLPDWRNLEMPVQPIRDQKKIDDMKKVLRGQNIRDYCMFVLGINTGLRISDILKLKINDIVDKKGRFKERIEITEKKTGKKQDIVLSQSAISALKEYLKTREDDDYDSPLFISRKSKRVKRPISERQAYYIINRAAKSVGIKDHIGTHTMRKTFGYHAYKKGYDITRIQKLLNHSSPAITLLYIGITRDELDTIRKSINL